MLVTALATTYLKPSTAQSADIPNDQLVGFRKGVTYDITSYTEEGDHYLLSLLSPLAGYRRWYVYKAHVQITNTKTVGGAIVPLSTPPANRKDILLDVPFYPQYDNYFNPSGSCNVTSIAMALAYLGVTPLNASQQLEDELYLYVQDHGLSRHTPEDLAYVVDVYGHKDNYVPTATFDMIHAHLEKGYPVVVHGYFTRSGHIVCIVGRTESSFIVHDPWGRWTPSGYDFNSSGEAEEYSYADMAAVLSPESPSPSSARHVWAHFISP